MRTSWRLWLVILPLALVSVFLAACRSEEESLPSASQTIAAASPTVTAAPSSAPTPSPVPSIPADWQTYTDPVLGFSLRYPPDLVIADLTGPNPTAGLNERVFQFRSPSEPSRSFSLSISSNPDGLGPEEWLLNKAACLPGTLEQGNVAGQPATLCTSQPEEIREAAVAFGWMGKILFITSIMPASGFESDFELMVGSIRL